MKPWELVLFGSLMVGVGATTGIHLGRVLSASQNSAYLERAANQLSEMQTVTQEALETGRRAVDLLAQCRRGER